MLGLIKSVSISFPSMLAGFELKNMTAKTDGQREL